MADQQHSLTHLGIILDGNRRWAKQHNLPVLEGHRRGAEVFKEVVLQAFDKGITYITAYTFSLDNWQRAEEEVTFLMGLMLKAVERYLDDFHKQGIKIVILGRRSGLDKKLVAALEKTEEKTAMNTRCTLGLCFNYGGQEEIVDAVKSLDPADIPKLTPVILEQKMYSSSIPPIDMIVRTSGENRLSGFMLWRASYAELMFMDKFWPDFTKEDIDLVLAEYAKRNRRYGGN